jgi:hypothetical protein
VRTDARLSCCGWLEQKKITHYFSANKAKIVTTTKCKFLLNKNFSSGRKRSDFVRGDCPLFLEKCRQSLRPISINHVAMTAFAKPLSFEPDRFGRWLSFASLERLKNLNASVVWQTS